MYNCKHCGETLPRYSTVRRQFCDDSCRVAYNRANKPKTAKKEAYGIIAILVHHALSERDWSNESQSVVEEMRKFSDIYR